ncbi:ATP-grasp domain-containing protein [Salinarimonas rosea]|uniref:ATP-grasp domain-containing protein n=1 Tax=Salinarimonas rosea TaxID=552063 RepID=UPI00048D7228|nr:hypothetical protein [Salinarimonas rosea]
MTALQRTPDERPQPLSHPAVLRAARRPLIWFVTDDDTPTLTASDGVLAAALEQRCARVRVVSWQGAASWSWDVPRCDAAVIRSSWNYHRNLCAYRDWLDLCSAQDVPLSNSAALVRGNLDKSCLADLPHPGARTPPIVLLEQVDAVEIALAMDERGWRKAVLKPRCGASGHGVMMIERHRLIEMPSSLVADGPVLLQEFCPEVMDGEWSLVLVDGRFVHAVRKEPVSGEFRPNSRFAPRVRADRPTRRMIADAEALVDALPERALYARVDGVQRGDRLVVLELELNEPGLFLDHDPSGGAARALASAILDRACRRVDPMLERKQS